MSVVGHQAVRVDLRLVTIAIVLEPGKVYVIILIINEDFKPAISPVCDMMRKTGEYQAFASSHSTLSIQVSR
jgi:hypothetical protein